MKTEVIFDTKLIDSSNYKKLKWVRYTLYIVLLSIGSVLVEPKTQFGLEISLQERLDLDLGNIVGILLIIGVLTASIYFYSTSYKEKGQISFFRDRILIVQELDKISLHYNDIKDLEIRRGATYHYEYQRDNYIHQANNWLSFNHNTCAYKYEFIIDSAAKNTAFESLILELRKESIKFEFKSI